MSKFKKQSKTSQSIPTSALPDIVFMLLFFFMVTTVLREQQIIVKQQIPDATQIRKLQRKSLVSYLYIGEPVDQSRYGSEPRIQANDVFITTDDVVRWVTQEKDKLDEVERDQITVALKVDEDAKRGLIADIEYELRKANARKLMYTVRRNVDNL